MHVGGSACESTKWSDLISVVSMVAAGVSGTPTVIMTAGVQVGSVPKIVSHDVASVFELDGEMDQPGTLVQGR